MEKFVKNLKIIPIPKGITKFNITKEDIKEIINLDSEVKQLFNSAMKLGFILHFDPVSYTKDGGKTFKSGIRIDLYTE